MNRITPNLWFDGNAETAASFYTTLFPDSHIDAVHRSPTDNPSTKQGDVLVVQFTLANQPFTAINGGPQFSFTEAISFSIDCQSQEEVDYYWHHLISNGGAPGQCGWCKDRFGLSWQVIPKQLGELLSSSDRAGAERTMQAMLSMTKLEIAMLESAFRGER